LLPAATEADKSESYPKAAQDAEVILRSAAVVAKAKEEAR
jgi:hypothetical protein